MIEVIYKLHDLRRVENDWNKLAASSNNPATQFDWFFHCAETLCTESRPMVFVYRDSSEIRAIAPLVLRRDGYRALWLELLGTAELYEPSDLLYADVVSLIPLLEGVLRHRLPVNLQRIPEASPVFDAAARVCRGRALLLKRPAAPSSYIAISTSWESFYKSLSTSRRADFRRKQNRAERHGEIQFAVVRPTLENLEGILEVCFRIEAASWKGRSGTSICDNLPLRLFFQRYAESAVRRNTLRIFMYSIGGQPVAMHLAVEFQRRLWILKLGHDEAWSGVSPGMHLANETIRYAFEHELEGYEFLGSEEVWQHSWPGSTHRYSSLLVYPASWSGLCGFSSSVMTFLRNRLRDIQGRVFPDK